MTFGKCENYHEGERTQSKFWRIPTIRQTYVMLGPMSLMFCAGAALGTATVMLPQLQASGEILVSGRLSPWIYSGHGIGSVPVALVGPFITQWKGYKLVFTFVCMSMIISCLFQHFATNSVHLLIAVLCQGVTKGGNISLGIMAITEYAEPRLRGPFLVIKSASYFWGVWVANAVGTFFHWRYISAVIIWPAIFALFSSFAWPDGPYWLASKGKTEECKAAFVWLRGPDRGTDELVSILKGQTVKHETPANVSMLTRIRKAIVLRQFYMPLSVNLVLSILYYSTGKTVFTVYSLIIIKEITGDQSTAYAGMLIIDGVTVLGMYIGSYVAMKVKRRVMLLSTTVATIVFLCLLSVYLSLASYEVISSNNIISLLLLVIYSLSVSWGPMILCTSFLSEISPMRFKNVIIAVSSMVFWALQVFNLRLAPAMFGLIGMHGAFGVYGIFTLICWIYLYKYLPETDDKTLQEMEDYFVKK